MSTNGADISLGLVAVTLCCNEAAELAIDILPATAATFGDRWLYLAKGKTPPGKFADPASGETVVEIQDATAEFANVGATTIETGELLRAVARLAAHCLGKRYCDGVVDGDDESLVRSLDDVANAPVLDRIVLWIVDYPPART